MLTAVPAALNGSITPRSAPCPGTLTLAPQAAAGRAGSRRDGCRLRRQRAGLAAVAVIDMPPAQGGREHAALRAPWIADLPTLTGQHDRDPLRDTVRLIRVQQDRGEARPGAVVPSAVWPRDLHDSGATSCMAGAVSGADDHCAPLAIVRL